jgi:ribosomal protein L7Ae-like RNA K-turn-binding protein
MSNILHLVSIARKAGKLEIGEEPTAAAARARQAKLILVAKDATENTYRRVRHFGDAGNVTWVSTPYTKAELGGAVGRSAVAMLAVMDVGLAAAMVRGLAQEDPEKFTVTMERMNAKAEKALRRQQEKRQHEKNLKTGKYQTKQRQKQAQEEAQARAEEAKRAREAKEAQAELEARHARGDWRKRPYERKERTERKARPQGEENRPGSRPHGSHGGGRKPYGSAPKNHSGNRRRTKGSGRSNRYEEFGPSGRPTRRDGKRREPNRRDS